MKDAKSAVGRNYAFLLAILFICLWIVCLPDEETMNTRNSDAPWHVLQVMECLEEAPVSVHKFLPLMTLEGEENRGIPWGGCLEAKDGRYYYLSFPPLQFVLPWLFSKLPCLGISSLTLFLLSGLCGLAAALLLFCLLLRLFRRWLPVPVLFWLTASIYLFSPEMLHDHVEVYWGQILYQPVLILQLLLFESYLENRENRRKVAALIFLAFLGPCLDWSAYVMNVGLVVLIWAVWWKRKKKEAIGVENIGGELVLAVGICIASAASLTLLLLHFHSIFEWDILVKTLIGRGRTRSFLTRYSDTLFAGYVQSFGTALTVLLILALTVCVQRSGRRALLQLGKGRIGLVWMASVLVCLENILLKQHATEYTYDRMKGILPIIIAVAGLMAILHTAGREGRIFLNLFCLILASCSFLDFAGFMREAGVYRWNAEWDYQENEVLAAALKETYTPENSVYGVVASVAVRGYSTLLFGRNLYEGVESPEALERIARERNVSYAVYLLVEWGEWQKDWYSGAVISNLEDNSRRYLTVSKTGEKSWRELEDTALRAMPFSSEDFALGVAVQEEGNAAVRLPLEESYEEKARAAAFLQVQDGTRYEVTGVTCWREAKFMDVTVRAQENALKNLRYPNAIAFVGGAQ